MMPGEAPRPRLGFNELLLGGVVLVTLTGIALGLVLYLLPADYLTIRGTEPGVRVAALSDLPVGASRIVSWGERILLVIRSEDEQFTALQGTSPVDACLLQWDTASRRVYSPCRDLVYDLHGNVVTGLTTRPLRRYDVRVLGGVLYVVDAEVLQ